MIKNLFMLFLAIFFPWLVLLIKDNPGGALIALIMQASVIGWLPASVWAWRTIRETRKIELSEKRKVKQFIKEARKQAKEEEKKAKEAVDKATKKEIQ